LLSWLSVRSLQALMCIICAGCSLATPYKPLGSVVPEGYRNEKLDEKTFLITFEANPNTSKELVESYWHRRATELCGSNAYISEMEVKMRSGQFSANKRSKYPYATGTATCK